MARTLTRDNFGPVFDADNHYWEASDAFTRHRDPKFRDRGLQVKEVDGVLRYVINDKIFQGAPGPADVHARPEPGSLLGLFAGSIKASQFKDAFDVPPSTRPDWYDRDKRLEVMDAQGIEQAWMFPSQGVILEAPMQNDVEASVEVFRAFNRWVHDDWGFAYKDRIFGVPYMNLSDPDKAVEELGWCVERGARVVNLRHGPAVTRDGKHSPAHPMFDRFWDLAQEVRVVVAFHGGADDTYKDFFALMHRSYGELPDGSTSNAASLTGSTVFGSLAKGRQVQDLAYMLVAHRLFERFPGLRMAFVETGSHWVPGLLHALESLGHGGAYDYDLKEQFIEHCWVTPYPEEDMSEFRRHYPAERILFGSDWPHGEGFVHPLDFFENIATFSDADVRKIMRDNARELTLGR